jgi:hypothetical protein
MDERTEAPFGVLVPPGRQRLRGAPFLRFEHAQPAALALLERLGVDGGDDLDDRRVELG